MKKNSAKIAAVIVWIIVWQLLFLKINSKLIFAGPVQTFETLILLLCKSEFYKVIFSSCARILCGFFISVALAAALAALSAGFWVIDTLLSPLFLLMKSVPVASLIIIALLWMGSKNVAVFIVVLIALPILWTQLMSGIRQTSRAHLRMAKTFGFDIFGRLCSVYIPAVKDGFLDACSLAVGMSFKAGVAAEVIAGTGTSIGEELYMAKLYFETGELFAWTGVIIFLSFVCEKAVVFFIKQLLNLLQSKRLCTAAWRECKNGKGGSEALIVRNLSKKYSEMTVLDGINLEVRKPAVVAVTGESGSGKTTLLRELETPDDAVCKRPDRVSIMYQESVLLEHLGALANVCMPLCFGHPAGLSRKDALKKVREALCSLGLEGFEDMAVSCLSKGQRRRVELARAMLADTGLVILDEPFSGLDEQNIQKAKGFIRKHSSGRIVVVAEHDIQRLDGLDVDFEVKV